MTVPVAIVDTGLCNIDSIARAAAECGGNVSRVTDAAGLSEATHVILPGVGAYSVAMNNLNVSGLSKAIRDAATRGAYILGICLGMQLLASSSAEGGLSEGLNLIPGDVKRLEPVANELVPHMGWNTVAPVRYSKLFTGLQSPGDFYFVHSYHFIPRDNAHVAAVTPYCGKFVSSVSSGNVFGVQFHPEKSMKRGLQLIRNFLHA